MRPLVAVLLALAAIPAMAQAPRFAGTYAFPTLFCDCDPADFVFRATRALPGHAEPDAASPVVRTVAAGRLIEGNDWSEVLTVVVRPGVAVARRAVRLDSLDRYGTGPLFDGEPEAYGAALALAAGDRLEYLAAEEGAAYVRVGGVVYGMDAWTLEDGAFGWERREPEVEFWFRLTPKPGRPAAWVRLDWEERAGNVAMLCHTHSLACERRGGD